MITSIIVSFIMGIFIGICFLVFSSPSEYYIKVTKIKKIIFTLIIIFSTILGIFLGFYINNYDLEKKIASFESIRITYSSIDTISEYDRISILQKVMEVNQDMAETKIYVNSWMSFGISEENKETINNLKLIGE